MEPAYQIQNREASASSADAANVNRAFRKVMEDQGYRTEETDKVPLRQEDLTSAIKSVLIACEPNTDKITGRYIGRLYERILCRLGE